MVTHSGSCPAGSPAAAALRRGGACGPGPPHGSLPRLPMLPPRPFLEWAILRHDALEQIASVQRGGLLEGPGRPGLQQPLERLRIDIHCGRVQGHGVASLQQQGRVAREGLANGQERLTETVSGSRSRSVGPEQCGQLVTGVRLARGGA